MATREPRPLKPKFAKARTPKDGARRTAAPDDMDGDVDDLSVDPESDEARQAEENRKQVLAATVSDRIRVMMDARQSSGIEEIWRQSQQLYDGEDTSESTGIVKVRGNAARADARVGGAKVVLNITKPKTDIGVSRVSEMLVPSDDKPWAIEATPIPDLDDGKFDPDQKVTLADGQQVTADALVAKTRQEAGEKSVAMADWIEDGFIECDAYAEMRKQIRSAGRMGTGVLKGPFPRAKVVRRWIDDKAGGKKLSKDTVIVPASRCIRAEDCFPDPACGDSIHDGADFAERDFLTGKKLRELAELPGYDAIAIAMALAEGPQVHTKTRRTNVTMRGKEGSYDNDNALYEVFYYYGEVKPEDMILLGLPAETTDESGNVAKGTEGGLTVEELQLYTLPCVLTMLNGRAIKCDVNPMEAACFPYDFFTWDHIDGQPWGRGIPWKMAVAQRMLTAAVRKLLENAGLASGPIIAYIQGAMTPKNGVYEIRGRTLWEFEPNEFIKSIRDAMQVFNIPSIQEELSKIIEFALQMADQLTNMPMLMQGDQQAGTSPETLGGMKLLLNNAMSPLRNLAKQHDDQTTKPHLKRWVDWGMEKGPENIKGDHDVKARGSTALVQREEGRAFLQMLYPMLDNPAFRIDPEKYVKEFAASSGYSMGMIQYSDEDWKKKQAEMQANPPPPPPAVMAAQIRAKSAETIAKSKDDILLTAEKARAQHEENDRQLRVEELRLKGIEREDMLNLAMVELAQTKGLALDAIKADLAKAAMNNRLETMDMQLKLNPANKSGTGIAGGVGDNDS